MGFACFLCPISKISTGFLRKCLERLSGFFVQTFCKMGEKSYEMGDRVLYGVKHTRFACKHTSYNPFGEKKTDKESKKQRD